MQFARRSSVRIAFALILNLLIVSTIHAQRGQAGPEPRIVTFEARPTAIRPGEPVILAWSTENPSGPTIEPEVGPVTARGTKQVKPSVTTTYTLALRGGPSKSVTVTVAGTTPANVSSAASSNA